MHHRVINCFDLVAVEAVYHKKCRSKFFLTPETTPDTVKRLAGRPMIGITLDGGTSIRMLHFLKKREKKLEINKLSLQYFFQS